VKKKLSIEQVKKLYHPKIWNKLKPIIESINAVIDLKILQDINETDTYRLYNLRNQFIRSLIFAESEKYVSGNNPTIEGIGHDYYAVYYCFEKILYNSYKKSKKLGVRSVIPADFIIKEEAEKIGNLGIHPKIDKAARIGYKKDNAEIMRQLAILINDYSLDFNAPAVIFVKEYYAIIIFILILILILAF